MEANLTAIINVNTPSQPSSVITVTATPTNFSTTPFPSKCAAEPTFTAVAKGFRYGDLSDSHGQLIVSREEISTDYEITLDFRTFIPYGLLFYLMSADQSEYLALQINNGRMTLSFSPNAGLHDSVSTDIFYDDGNWHMLQLTRRSSTLSMTLDGAETKTAVFFGRMKLEPLLYVGGLPRFIVTGGIIIRTSFHGCIRDVRLQGVYLDLESTAGSKKDIGMCYSQVEQGAYFDGFSYGVLERNIMIEPGYNIRLEFKTNRLDAVIFSISNTAGDSALALEVLDGRVKLTELTPHGEYSAMSNGKSNVCDNRWHNVIIELFGNVITLQIDHGNTDMSFVTPAVGLLEIDSSLYIGGYPASAMPQGATHTNEKFKGCMKNVILNGRRIEMYKILEIEGIYSGSCPV